jgi:hypothetical protein
MRWCVVAAAMLAIAVAIACGQNRGSREILPPQDTGSDAGHDGGVDAGYDAGDGGPDAGPDGGVDAGPWSAGEVKTITDSAGWHFVTDGLPSGNVMGASADEDGNIWVAGRNAGVFVQRGGSGRFQQFTLADGLHPYGYLPGGWPADTSPSLDQTPAISISGGPGSSAFVGYGGKGGCEDEWDRFGDNHGKADPSIYKSGDADRLVLNGRGINVAHYDIFSGPGVVGNELAGREKLCSVYRVVWQRGTNYVWFGANHGFALGRADYAGDPGCNGNPGCSGNLEHWHPAVNDKHGWFVTDLYYGVAIDTWPHVDSAGTTFFDVWFGGLARTTRFRFGEKLGNIYAAGDATELYVSKEHNPANIADDPAAQAAFWNRMDIWPDKITERWDAAHGVWLSSEPDFRNPDDWVFDNVTGIAVMTNGDAWIGSSTNGLRLVDHDGHYKSDATSVLPTKAIGALAKDPLDDSVWVGYRDTSDAGYGVTRIKQDGTVLHYRGLGAQTYSPVWDIQVQPGTATSKRRILVAFRRGAVGIYEGD